MIRTALDSDQLDAFVTGTNFVLVYTDLITDPVAFERLHDGRQVVYIDRGLGDPGGKASIADVERGALAPADLPKWCDQKADEGHAYLTYYCDRSTVPACEAALKGRLMFRWVATLDGTIGIDGFRPFESPDLIQLVGAAQLGFHADFSLVLNATWHPNPAKAKMSDALADVRKVQSDVTAIHAAMGPLASLIERLD